MGFKEQIARFVLIAVTTVGCVQFSVTQRDESPDERIITTQVKATAFFSSAQAIKNATAIQTDKSQKVGAESVNQESSATNFIEILKWLATMPR